MSYLLAFIVTLVYVFTRSFQQLNVTHSRYWWILPTSMIMATMDVTIVSLIVKHDGNVPLLCFSMGLGGGLGSMSATFLHNHWRAMK